MSSESRLVLPVILGTAREGRRSEHAARFVHEELQKREEVQTDFWDVRDFRLPATNDNQESSALVKKYREMVAAVDGLIIVTPEYNHSYPGELKMMLDMAYEEYEHKPVALCGAGGGMGGVRAVEQLRSVIIELKAMPILEAVYFSNIGDLFDAEGKITNPAYHERVQKLLDELVWYAKALKVAREEKV
ncbi:MAG: NAD(P)H-dependent oxidoreductase [Candidatus Sungbacteria bacterium]|nr:NAD(P)H-dependent oxidoreductase [Candidatus Sungbacteria bacterium]